MKLYNSVGPNPHIVRMFLHEKGIEIPMHKIDVRGGENRREPYLQINPSGQCPALELDDGSVISEIVAICEYFEDIQPQPALIGATPEEKAETRMWARRIDLNFNEPTLQGFRYAEGLEMFKTRMICVPEAADGLKAIAKRNLGWLDGLMAGKQFVVGDRFTLADVMLYCLVQFASRVGQKPDPDLANIQAWFDRVKVRPSAEA